MAADLPAAGAPKRGRLRGLRGKSRSDGKSFDWIFPWRHRSGSRLATLLAIGISGGVFGLALAFLKVNVAPPVQWAERKASVIRFTGAAGKRWAAIAQENGPFPSRYDPSSFPAIARLEHAAMHPTSPQKRALPPLRDLPGNDSMPAAVAGEGERVFPETKPPAVDPREAVASAPVPSLYPLAGISEEELPSRLPDFTGPVDPRILSSADWRFVVRLGEDGRVTDSISLADGDPAMTRALEEWLKTLRFPSSAERNAWIAFAVLFTQPPSDGTDAR